MDEPPKRFDEKARLAELRALGLLDTDAEERFDRYTRLAQKVLGVPMAAICLVDDDRAWFKSRLGLEAAQTPREHAFCGRCILEADILEVADASRDQRFTGNPLVTGTARIRFYAGYPLRGPQGHHVGTLCLFDTRPRSLSDSDREVFRDLGELVIGELESVALATTDALTGICNRRGFESLSEQAMAFCARNRAPVSVLMIDLDMFKAINDEWGHAEGDAALRDLASQLVRTFRDSDVVGRLGGDEFAVLLSGTAGNQAQMGADRLQRAVDTFNGDGARHWDLRLSIGISELTGYRLCDLPAAMARADQPMYAHKRARRLRRLAV